MANFSKWKYWLSLHQHFSDQCASSRISFYWTSSSRKIVSTRLDSIVQCMSFCGHGSSTQIGLLDVQQILLDVHQSRRFGEMTFSLPGKSEVRIMSNGAKLDDATVTRAPPLLCPPRILQYKMGCKFPEIPRPCAIVHLHYLERFGASDHEAGKHNCWSKKQIAGI